VCRKDCLRKIAAVSLSSLIVLLGGCNSDAPVKENPADVKVLVLGMDGLDPILLEQLMAEDRLPNFSRLAAMGDYSPFGTSMPPQSPVAWSNFISGSNPGTHDIFDFIHRDPNPDEPGWSIKPYSSMSEAFGPEDPENAWSFGRWRIPLDSGGVKNLRRGDAFWDHLISNGIDATIYRMPANYPPPNEDEVQGPGALKVLCGMGTPDLLGGFGDFTSFQEQWDRPEDTKKVSGGLFKRLTVEKDRTVAVLDGPENYLLKSAQDEPLPKMTVELEIVRDPVQDVITVKVGDEKRLLQKGEWSNWIPIDFKTGLPGSTIVDAMGMPTSLNAIIRLYVKEVHPYLDVYVSPINIDPSDPVNPISYPPEWSAEIAATTGVDGMYTTGIPEDEKALRAHALNEDEFLSMVNTLVDERLKQYHAALKDFKRGLLYFYFGHTDQLAHIFYRDMDPRHPGRKPEQAGKYDDVIFSTYVQMDDVLGEAFEIMDDNDVLIAMSDHGFCSFRRGFNVNTWLIDNGYMAVKGMDRKHRREGLFNIKFKQSRAYAIGINCFYINLQGREKDGIVPVSEKRRLMEEIAAKLEQVRDEDGTRAIEKAYIVEDLYPDADPLVAPDILIGYRRNYRGSWSTALGGMGKNQFVDNKDRWSGDHCIAMNLVPGVLLSNMKIAVDDPELSDLGPAILQLFGVKPPAGMIQRNIFGEKTPLRGAAGGK